MSQRTIVEKFCLNCQKTYKTIDKRKKFCGRSCAAQYNNTGRTLTEEHKKKVSEKLKLFYQENPNIIRRGEQQSLLVAKSTKGKYNKAPKNIFSMSTRTTKKILYRMNLSCSKCGWNEAVCDLHHINGRKINDPHNHKNLSYLCPNCHRLAGNGKLNSEDLVNFEEQIGDKWLQYYYG